MLDLQDVKTEQNGQVLTKETKEECLLIGRSEKVEQSKSVGKGTQKRTLVSLLQGTIGAGCLGLPICYKENGIVVSIVMTITCCLLCRYMFHLLFEAARMQGCTRYVDLVRVCLGNKFALFFDVVMFGYIFGCILAYFILISQIMTHAIHQIGETSLSDDWLRVVIIGVVMVCNFPLTYQRDFSKLSFVSSIGFALILYIILMVIVETPFYMIQKDYQSQQIIYQQWNIFFIVNFVLNIFALTCTSFIFEVTETMADQSPKTVSTLHSRFIGILAFLHLVLGLCGYLSTLDNTDDIILYRHSFNGQRDYFMLFAQFGMSTFIYFCISINIKPGRQMMCKWITGQEEADFKWHTIITAFFVFLPAIFGMVYPEVLNVFSVLAGYGGNFFMVTFPGLCYIKSNKKQLKSFENITILIIVITLTVLALVGGTLSLLDTFKVISIKK